LRVSVNMCPPVALLTETKTLRIYYIALGVVLTMSGLIQNAGVLTTLSVGPQALLAPFASIASRW